MKRILPSTLITAGILMFAVSCKTNDDDRPRQSAAEATATLAQQKDLAEQWAERLKANSDLPAAARRTAEEKYRLAASHNKGFLEAMRGGIINNEDLTASSTYKSIANRAEQSTKDFVDYAKEQSGAAPAVRSVTTATAVVGIVVDAGLTIWKNLRAQKAAEREAKADDLVQRLTWINWSKIQ